MNKLLIFIIAMGIYLLLLALVMFVAAGANLN